MLTSEIKCVTYFQIAYEIKLYILDQFSKIQSSAPMDDLSTLFFFHPGVLFCVFKEIELEGQK